MALPIKCLWLEQTPLLFWIENIYPNCSHIPHGDSDEQVSDVEQRHSIFRNDLRFTSTVYSRKAEKFYLRNNSLEKSEKKFLNTQTFPLSFLYFSSWSSFCGPRIWLTNRKFECWYLNWQKRVSTTLSLTKLPIHVFNCAWSLSVRR